MFRFFKSLSIIYASKWFLEAESGFFAESFDVLAIVLAQMWDRLLILSAYFIHQHFTLASAHTNISVSVPTFFSDEISKQPSNRMPLIVQLHWKGLGSDLTTPEINFCTIHCWIIFVSLSASSTCSGKFPLFICVYVFIYHTQHHGSVYWSMTMTIVSLFLCYSMNCYARYCIITSLKYGFQSPQKIPWWGK